MPVFKIGDRVRWRGDEYTIEGILIKGQKNAGWVDASYVFDTIPAWGRNMFRYLLSSGNRVLPDWLEAVR